MNCHLASGQCDLDLLWFHTSVGNKQYRNLSTLEEVTELSAYSHNRVCIV